MRRPGEPDWPEHVHWCIQEWVRGKGWPGEFPGGTYGDAARNVAFREAEVAARLLPLDKL